MPRPIRFFRLWWRGRDVRVDPLEPDTIGGMGVIHETEKRYHWTRRAVAACIAWGKNNKGSLAALAGFVWAIFTQSEKLAIVFEKIAAVL